MMVARFKTEELRNDGNTLKKDCGSVGD